MNFKLFQTITLVQQNIIEVPMPSYAKSKVNVSSHTLTFLFTSQNQFHIRYLILKLRPLQRNKKA